MLAPVQLPAPPAQFNDHGGCKSNVGWPGPTEHRTSLAMQISLARIELNKGMQMFMVRRQPITHEAFMERCLWSSCEMLDA